LLIPTSLCEDVGKTDCDVKHVSEFTGGVIILANNEREIPKEDPLSLSFGLLIQDNHTLHVPLNIRSELRLPSSPASRCGCNRPPERGSVSQFFGMA
jgi:hypothetical protein